MWIKFLLLFFVLAFLLKTDTSFDQDLGRHLKLGEIISQTKQVPTTNLFSYTNPSFPFINTHWLFEVFVYLFSQSLGVQPLIIFKILVILLSAWLLIKTIPKENQVLLLPIGFIFLHVLRERTELRPEIFSFLFTAGTYYILEKYLKGPTKLVFFLPAVQLIWINTHIYFFVGLLLQAVFLIHLLFKRSELRWHLLLAVFFVSIVVSLLNPNGLSGLLFPLNVSANYGYTIVENQTMFLLESIGFRDANFLFVKIAVSLVTISLIFALASKKFEIKNLLLAGLGMILALINVRSFPYLVFLSLPAVLMNLPDFKFKGFIKAATFLTIPILILESYFYLSGDYYRFGDQPVQVGLEFKESGKAALDFLISNDLPQPIFNNFDIGSYIIYRSYPKYKVFVDGRPEAYPKNFFLETYIPVQSDYIKFKQLDEKIGFKTVIFSHTDQTPWGRNFLQNVVKDENWSIVYLDDLIIILVKKEVALAKNLAVLSLDQLDPTQYNFKNHVSHLRLGIFLLTTGNQASANAFFKKTYQLFPQSPILAGKKNNFFW